MPPNTLKPQKADAKEISGRVMGTRRGDLDAPDRSLAGQYSLAVDCAHPGPEKCARKILEKHLPDISLIVNLREPEYKYEKCDDLFNIFRYRNRKGRCSCGEEIH